MIQVIEPEAEQLIVGTEKSLATVTEPDAVQPFGAWLTVTEYTPAELVEILEVVNPLLQE